MTEKLDPNLKARVEALAVGAGAAGGRESASIDAADMVEVLVGLDGPASDAELAALKASGLSVRSVLGDVLTGTIPAGRVAGVAAHPKVVKIEASGGLQMERPPTD